jgi:2-succinyl-5-enolpyruvyl-6-hydroxy-3-cyclohexene-1-carboxylate synthase
MSDKGQLALNWSTEFLKKLVLSGVQDAIISPGSRSTPLVLAAHRITSLRKRVVIDERSAAFQALGIAKATSRPVILICTSGTAAANYFPAIVEANLSRVPLIVITADRPAKLRNIGAQQTIDQVKLFGNHAMYFELGEPKEEDLNRLPILASQVMYEASKAQVIHVNAAFRKPLEPEQFENSQIEVEPDAFQLQTGTASVNELILELSVAQRPVFIFGPSILPSFSFDELYEWANDHQIPCITESLSQITPTIGLIEGALRHKEVRELLKPDLIVRFGRQPVSKSLELYLDTHRSVPHVHFDFFDVWHDATFSTDAHFFGKPDLAALQQVETQYDESWLDLWNNLLREGEAKRNELLNSDTFTDGQVIHLVCAWGKFEALHLSNSYPIRDIETFGRLNQQNVYCNRGANGIDGVLATALGNSVAHASFCSFIGDVAFLHDASSLAYHRSYAANHTIILINNGGGRIFEMLPISKSAPEILEKYFQTPVAYQAEQICAAFGISYQRVQDSLSLQTALNQDYIGLRLIECITDSKTSQKQRREILS